ncbi:hypothetical protein QBC46DRAFT_368066 [Diplogelasinospora grovesii]|uniref:Carbohydrate-binding module family 18 protein n=1 Tax=Diplogelasinospora grovesii TaxID=303347 RepID=A0AAN6MWA5_9PEZI|nr:hypothetical protein QBC46DRAFT_368066 [Diplogelasinospora grovesii]
MRLFTSSLLLFEGAYNPKALKRTNGTISSRTTLVTTMDTEIQPGDVNCRYSATTSNTVNYYTCTQMATKYSITVDGFFTLNPTLKLNCNNIQPKTEYCVNSFIEPVRATDQLCGPPNGNATCLGTAYHDDCAASTCYEGACAGDTGDCCNLDGACGTGDDFCGTSVCFSSNCTIPDTEPTLPNWMNGNTPDGTCGGEHGYTCNVVYGTYCNKDGIYGVLTSDYGAGYQPEFGDCSSVSTTSASSTTSKSSSSTSHITATPTSKTTTTSTTSTIAFSSLPSCGQTCFNNMLDQWSELGCSSEDPACLCSNVNFGYGLRDCSNGACGTAVASTVIAYGSAYCSSALATATPTATGAASLPACGQTCFNNMVAMYSSLGCASPDPSCLCSNVNFGYGLRDCSNGACGTDVASTVIAYGSAYCASASATATPTATGTCFNNMVAIYSSLGCASPDPSCLCSNVNFGYGLRDCSNGACGTDVASTVIAYGSAYCASASATATAKA